MSTGLGTAQSYAAFDIWRVLSFDWWLQHLSDSYRENPYHMITELFLIILLLWFLFKQDQRKTPTDYEKLSNVERENLIREWEPEPLVPPNIQKHTSEMSQTFHINSAVSSIVTASHSGNDHKYVNLSSHNYLGFAQHEKVKQVASDTIKKYAVGSCGPRGFYGTMDIHLKFEYALAKYFNNHAIIYADYIGCAASVITAFAKRGDLLIIDEGCHALITQGAHLSRSNVIWYRHNDMDSLEQCLQNVNEEDERHNRALNRRFIITEGIFHNHGSICKLNTIVKLKEDYKYRLILDDSHAFGTIHKRGTPGFYGITFDQIDMYFAGMDKVLGSTGGFCVGDKEIVHHQSLSGAGYVFSASAPPFSCAAAQCALELLDENGEELCKELCEKAKLMRALLADDGVKRMRWDIGDASNSISPLIHLRFTNVSDDDIAEKAFEQISEMARLKGVLVFNSIFLPREFNVADKSNFSPSLRICVCKEHTKEQLQSSADILKQLLIAYLDGDVMFAESAVVNNRNVDHDDEKHDEDLDANKGIPVISNPNETEV